MNAYRAVPPPPPEPPKKKPWLCYIGIHRQQHTRVSATYWLTHTCLLCGKSWDEYVH